MRLQFSVAFDTPGFYKTWASWCFGIHEHQGEFGSREYQYCPEEWFFIRVLGFCFMWNWIGAEVIVRPWPARVS